MARVKNTDVRPHRVGGFLFPVGEFVEVQDDALVRWLVKEMRFEVEAQKPAPIADGAPVVKPAKGVKK